MVEVRCRNVSYADLDRVLDGLFEKIPANTPRAIRITGPLVMVDERVFDELRQNHPEVRS